MRFIIYIRFHYARRSGNHQASSLNHCKPSLFDWISLCPARFSSPVSWPAYMPCLRRVQTPGKAPIGRHGNNQAVIPSERWRSSRCPTRFGRDNLDLREKVPYRIFSTAPILLTATQCVDRETRSALRLTLEFHRFASDIERKTRYCGVRTLQCLLGG